VAKRIPGATKAEVKQLVEVKGTYTDVYGAPLFFMRLVRNSDINHTPDIRTRAILPRWYCVITVEFVQPQLNADAIVSLVGAAGMLNGVGDWRQQKGSGNYGQFEIVKPDDPRIKVLKKEGMKAQDQALQEPVAYDKLTEDLFAHYQHEVERRELEPKRERRARPSV